MRKFSAVYLPLISFELFFFTGTDFYRYMKILLTGGNVNEAAIRI